MKILLTGFSGTLGRPFARRLLSEGHTVRALFNGSAIDRRDLEEGVEIVWGTLYDHDRFDEFTRGVDAVVHCAWESKQWPEEGFEKANVRGSVELFRAAERNGVKTFLYVSSVGVYGLDPLPSGLPMSESSPFVPEERSLDVYPWAKVRIERAIARAAEGAETNLVIVRPGLLFSDRKAPAKRFFRNGTKGVALMVGGAWNHLPYIHVEDVGDLMYRILLDPPRRGVYNAVPSLAVGSRRFVKSWGALQGLRVSVLRLPVAVFTRMGLLAYRLKTALKKRAFRPNTRYQSKTATRHVVCSPRRAQERFGWVDERTREIATAGRRSPHR